MKGFDRLFGGLMGGEAGPFMPHGPAGILRLLQVPLRLPKPVPRLPSHRYLPSRVIRTLRLGSSPTEYEERPAWRAISCCRRRMKAF